MQELRLLQEKDLESIYPIYVHYVKTSVAIFDVVPDSFDVFKEHMMEVSKTNPFYVALNDDVLIGYGYVHPAFSKEAYKYCVELTIYFKEGKHYGLPSKMLDQLEADCRKLNMRWIISCITDSNEESIAFHKKHGFTMYGALPSCGMKFDVWHGVVWLCKRLDEVKKDFSCASNATILGNVSIGKDSSVWYNAVIRSEEEAIEIGQETNIQDQCVLHTDRGCPLKIGDRVTIGHGAIVHGCTIADEVLIGMGAIILNGACIGSHSIIGAGCVVPENMVIAYVDGSFEKSIGRYAFGCVILTPAGEEFRKSGSGCDPEGVKIRNVAGEMLGAMNAVQWAKEHEYPAVEIRYDYEGVEKWVTGVWRAKTPLTSKYAAHMQEAAKQIKISFCKVAAHTGNHYNEEADQLAKSALLRTDENVSI